MLLKWAVHSRGTYVIASRDCVMQHTPCSSGMPATRRSERTTIVKRMVHYEVYTSHMMVLACRCRGPLRRQAAHEEHMLRASLAVALFAVAAPVAARGSR